ncbi:tRNA threonylcarbamoyladenosine dehydratase [Lentisphaerota bacterium ZTH]|nr:tRNA threonylcarbamoyladenosine dehydratase [Lentisphaerota bacterium]WET06049.1 tRNA threonylcarbamoyladenosine dehydratase [Lentisphaerota bacterium ZTH]
MTLPLIEKVPQWQQRTAMLLKREGLEILKNSRVLVVGLGGVGAYAAELICRAGVGKMTVVDSDAVEASNRNRQLPALSSTEGRSKAGLMADRLRDINPEAEITPLELFLRDELTDEVLNAYKYDYVVDAIDTLSPKVNLISKCVETGYPLVSSMGAGGKTDPTRVQIADISKSYNCPLAKAIRKRLHRRGIRKGFKAVFSPEDVPPHAVHAFEDADSGKCGSVVGTISYMPPTFGCCCASVVLRELTGQSSC